MSASCDETTPQNVGHVSTLVAMASEPGPTPLVRKVGVRPGDAVATLHAPRGWGIDGLPDGCRVVDARDAADLNVIIAFFTSAEQLRSDIVDLSERITDDGMVWLAWPRRAGGHTSDLTDGVVREAALALGLVDVKVAALDIDWSALKVVWRKELRGRRPRRRGSET